MKQRIRTGMEIKKLNEEVVSRWERLVYRVNVIESNIRLIEVRLERIEAAAARIPR